MKFHASSNNGRHPFAIFDDEPAWRSDLLQGLLIDADGQEDYYLGEIAKGEAGERITNCYNELVHLYPFPDVVVIEDMWDQSLGPDEVAEGPPAAIFFPPAEIKQLILDWMQVRDRWYAERRRAAAN